jgi:large subunit ribosomal protein L15
MPKLHDLQPNEGARKKRQRVGRGVGSGRDKTSGRGHKGQNARSGGGVRPGFEGGQMPLFRRIPKRGFSNQPFKKDYTIVNLEKLTVFDADAVITPEVLKEEGIIKRIGDGVKILARGELDRALTIKAHKFSGSAVEKIEAAGGKAEVI